MNFLRNLRSETPQNTPQPANDPAKNAGSIFKKFESEAIVPMEDLLELKGGKSLTPHFFNLKNSCGSVLPQ